MSLLTHFRFEPDPVEDMLHMLDATAETDLYERLHAAMGERFFDHPIRVTRRPDGRYGVHVGHARAAIMTTTVAADFDGAVEAIANTITDTLTRQRRKR